MESSKRISTLPEYLDQCSASFGFLNVLISVLVQLQAHGTSLLIFKMGHSTDIRNPDWMYLSAAGCSNTCQSPQHALCNEQQVLFPALSCSGSHPPSLELVLHLWLSCWAGSGSSGQEAETCPSANQPPTAVWSSLIDGAFTNSGLPRIVTGTCQALWGEFCHSICLGCSLTGS